MNKGLNLRIKKMNKETNSDDKKMNKGFGVKMSIELENAFGGLKNVY
ncbi:hypothetical protein GOV12_01530 [Candidatus Pacearchaeota archaeon]|nr:hypothetical protein [Candidatus Pacearchaeota archaeon]